VKAEFVLGSAETFSRPAAFDVVLHFGTLYHLPNPLLALKTTFDNLKPGGWLALETQTYDHPNDRNLCYFIHGHNNDPTNFWAISEHVLTRCMTFIGFTGIDVLLKVSPPMLGQHMNRVIVVARKPG
jgi:SAM-dependent methyltransferase